MIGFLVPIATWLGANPAALAGLAISVGMGLGYVSGKVNGWFQCQSNVAAATERARITSIQRDLDIARRAHQVDKKLAEKLQKELDEAEKRVQEFTSNSDCPLSRDDIRRLRHIR